MITLAFILISFMAGFAFCWVLKRERIINEPAKRTLVITCDASKALKELDQLSAHIKKLETNYNNLKTKCG